MLRSTLFRYKIKFMTLDAGERHVISEGKQEYAALHAYR